MAAAAGMTSAIMNPVQVATTTKKIEERIAALAAMGIVIPDGIDMDALAPLIGLGFTKATPSKEIEAIKAANFLMDNDSSGGNWIRFNKPPASANTPQGARGDREGRRRRRA